MSSKLAAYLCHVRSTAVQSGMNDLRLAEACRLRCVVPPPNQVGMFWLSAETHGQTVTYVPYSLFQLDSGTGLKRMNLY